MAWGDAAACGAETLTDAGVGKARSDDAIAYTNPIQIKLLNRKNTIASPPAT
jgi:hypothetical protein